MVRFGLSPIFAARPGAWVPGGARGPGAHGVPGGCQGVPGCLGARVPGRARGCPGVPRGAL
eukprot:1376347-Pyramimonas_sp.AAC.1